MPRPPLYHKGSKSMPSAQLEEVKFWLDIMQEHTVFIRAGIPAEHTDLINEAKNFYQELGALRARAERPQTEKKFAELISDALCVITELYKFKRHLLHLAMTGRLGGSNPPLFYDHVAREAEYVLQLFAEIKKYNANCRTKSKAEEVAFWLRIMADHGRFISDRLDPSERNLAGTAIGFADEFDQLYLEGRDYVSMLRGYNREVPAFDRFVKDARMATIRLRDFKRATVTMLEERRLLGTIPVPLADHVRREADHFLVILAIVVKGLKKYVEDDEIDMGIDFVANQVGTAFAEDDSCAVGNLVLPTSVDCLPKYDDHNCDCDGDLSGRPPSSTIDDDDDYLDDETDDDYDDDYDDDLDETDDDEIDDDDYDERDDDDIIPVAAEPSNEVHEDHVPEPPPKAPKYKWTGKWPRPLGQVTEEN